MRHSLVGNKKTWFYSPWVTCILVLFVISGAISVVRAYQKQREAVSLRNESLDQMKELNQKQADLTNQIQSLSTDRGVEAEVRERYRVVKPGEQLVIVVDNGAKPSAITQQTFWQKVRVFLGI